MLDRENSFFLFDCCIYNYVSFMKNTDILLVLEIFKL